MQQSQNMNEKELFKLLNELRILKRNGDLDIDEKLEQQVFKWRNILDYCILEAAVKHYSEECRLEALALLTESKKSTLRFTHKELDIILSFLKYNLCEKMEYIPFIKKILKRLKDSLAVMQRQLAQEIKMRNYHEADSISETYKNILLLSNQISNEIEENIKVYNMFLINLRELCVNNLYPDATYHRRRSSLQILLLLQDLLYYELKDIEWKEEQAKIIFQCLLLDTYEPNKEMAYQILKRMNPTLLCLDSESRVRLIIKVALELGNSMRPIDSVTSAYMLKISKFSPIIRDVLCDYCNVEDNSTNAVTLQLILLLYTRLKESLALAKRNMGMAIIKCSLYGYLFCIRSLLCECDLRSVGLAKLYQNIIANIILLCFELNHTVSIIVNNSSPEGHLPMDLEILNLNNDISSSEKEIITPQMVLLCSWRTVKEVSQLFGLLATKASIQTDETTKALLLEGQIEDIMKHLVFLLCETKHRGAFEQAYIGFHQLCTRLWRLNNVTLQRLPIHWLHDILIGITGLIPGYSKLCATRRSAGVPFLIQAVLSSEPRLHDNSKMSTFHSVMKILLEFAELENTVNLWQKIKCILYENTEFSKYEHLITPIKENEYHHERIKINITEIKTHSLNILRTLFRHSQLGDIVKDYIADGLMTAFKNYDSKTWAERNAATLLFSALVIRIFGVQRTKDHINLTTDNKMTGRIFFERYPNLLPFILHELQSYVSINDTTIKSNIQAILLLLSRLYISDHFDKTDITWKINEFVNLVSQCAKSPVYKTRELAARALVPLLTESTAHNFVKKLFLALCTTPDTRISANLIHGYLLQILEIFRRLPSVNQQLLEYDITNFLNMANWILSGLERKTNNSSCFLIASVYIDILHELHKVDKSMIESYNMKHILHICQQHLMEKDLLKHEPGEQMYKVSMVKFILCLTKRTDFLRIVQGGQSKIFEIYSKLLIIPDAEIQNIAWTTVIEILNTESSRQQRKLLSNYAIRVVADFVNDLYKYNPNLQDAIFDFLYNSLIYINESWDSDASFNKRQVCNLVMKIHVHDISSIYSERKNYLRLLGKCMTTLTHELKDEELSMEDKTDVYRKVCNSDWIGTLYNKDFRSSVFDILYDLYGKNGINHEYCYFVLDWWTTLLQLLVNDNVEIRREASTLICKIEPSNEVECIERMLSIFFQKFNKIVVDKCPEIAISAVFCWSVSLLGDINYEMDETDVFNKCRNYDIFEPVRISELCFNSMKLIMQRYSIDNLLPPDTVKWMNYRLDTNFSILSSFRDIVRSYKINIPILEKEFEEILNPTYKDKLLQVLACEKYISL